MRLIRNVTQVKRRCPKLRADDQPPRPGARIPANPMVAGWDILAPRAGWSGCSCWNSRTIWGSRMCGRMAVTFPVHVEAPPTSTEADQTPDCKRWTSIDEARRRRRRTGWGQRALVDWLHPGDMEGGADLHGWELKPHHRWADDPLDGERTHEPRR